MATEPNVSTAAPAEAHSETPPASTEQQPQDGGKQKVTFDEKQQAKLEELLAKARSESAKALRLERDAYKAELERERAAKLLPQQEADALAETSAKLAKAREELAGIEATKLQGVKDAALRAAAEDAAAIDPAVFAQLMQNHVVFSDGAFLVVNPKNSAPRLNAHGEPMTVGELAAELAERHKYMIKGTVRGGSGSFPASGAPVESIPLESLFGPRSDGGAANRLALRNPAEYRRLRQQAREKGLIA
jgi:hypothetical protein